MDEKKLENSLWRSSGNYSAYYTNGVGLISFSDAETYCEILPDIKVFIHDSGMVATHNMPCPVCKTKHAVFEASKGYFNVCRGCEEEGYTVSKKSLKLFRSSKWYTLYTKIFQNLWKH